MLGSEAVRNRTVRRKLPLITKLPREVNKFHNPPLIEKGGTGQTVAKKITEQVSVFYAPHLVRSTAAHPS